MKLSTTAFQLLQRLADGDFHSGQTLGKQLGVSRSAVWKGIQQLQKFGIEIHALAGKGYCIPCGIELLDKKRILQQLQAASTIDELQLHTTVGSTNDLLLALAQTKPRQTIACLAEHQSAGRGRQGKPWVTGLGYGLCLSLLWHFDKDPSDLTGLSLAVAVALVNALKTYGIKQGLTLKWPNDLLFNHRKLAGILIDMLAESHHRCSVVIGIGLNVRLPFAFTPPNQQPIIDVASLLPHKPSRNKLAALIIDELCAMLPEFASQGLSPYRETWQSLNSMQGKPVQIITSQHKILGTMQGITERGELVLLTNDNTTRHFLSGEVSLRFQ